MYNPAGIPQELENHPKFHIVCKLGEGDMGAVFLAQHLVMGKQVAIRVVNKALLDRPEALEQFQREIRLATQLNHPNIARLLEADQAGGLHLLVMEFVEGQNLAQLVQATGPLSVEAAFRFAQKVAQGLQYAYQKGMVHWDIKPQNLMMTHEGLVKILGYGLGRLAWEGWIERGSTKQGVLVETPEYVAPELATNLDQANIRADIYSLGCCLYYLLTGNPPFADRSVGEKPVPLHQVVPEVSVELSAVVARMMDKDPWERYETPAEAALALVPFCQGDEDQRGMREEWNGQSIVREERFARPGSPVEVPRDRRRTSDAGLPAGGKPRRGNPYLVAILVFMLCGCMLTGILGIVFSFFTHSQRPAQTIIRPAPTTKGPVFCPLIAGPEPIPGFTTYVQGQGRREVFPSDQKKTFWLPEGDYQVEYRRSTNDALWRQGHFTLVQGGGIVMGNAWGLETIPSRPPQPEPRSEFLGHGCQESQTYETGGVWDLAFSPTESVVASAGGDGTVKIWNWRQPGKDKPIVSLNHGSHVRGVAFSPDGQVLVSVGFNGMARVWQSARINSFLINSLQMTAGLLSVCFAPDGENVFVGGGKGLVEMWNWKTGRKTGQFQGHTEDVVAMALSPDGTRLATSSFQDAQIHLWSVGTREILQSFSEPHRPAGAGLAFSRDGKTLALGGSGGVVRYCNVNSGELTSKIPLNAWVGSLAFSPDGAKLAVGGPGYMLRIYDAQMDGLINDIDAHWNNISRVAFSPDGTILATASLDNSVRLWEVSKLPKVSSEKFHNSLGLSLHGQGKFPEAIEEFRQALKANPESSEAQTNLGMVFRDQGKTKEAIDAYRRALAIETQYFEALLDLAWLLAVTPDPQIRNTFEAIQVGHRAVALTPKYCVAWHRLGVARYYHGDMEGANKDLMESVKLSAGGSSWDYFFLAAANHKLANKDKAKSWYDRGVAWMEKNQPNDPFLRRFRAEAEEVLGLGAPRELLPLPREEP